MEDASQLLLASSLNIYYTIEPFGCKGQSGGLVSSGDEMLPELVIHYLLKC
jgi:hypothetical protein